MILISIALLLVLGAGMLGVGSAEEALMSVELQTDKELYRAGETVRLTATLSNRGADALSDIIVRVPLADLNGRVECLAGGEKATLETTFNIPDNFYLGYIGVGVYAKCAGNALSSQGSTLVKVDEPVSNPFFKEIKLPPLPDDWESEVSLDRFPVQAAEPQAGLGTAARALQNMALSSNGYTDTIAVDKNAERIDGCRAYRVTLSITGTPPPEKPVDVILVIDRSGSMADGQPYSAMYYAKQAAQQFAQQVLTANPNNRVAVVSFDYPGTSLGRGAQSDARTDIVFSSSLTQVTNAINSLNANGGTNTEAGFIQARNLLGSARDGANKAIVFLTDGVPTISNGRRYGPSEPTAHNDHTIAAYQAGISCHSLARVFTVNLLTGVPSQCLGVARDTMQKAQNSGYYETFSAADLSGIYGQISQVLNYSATAAVVNDKIPANFEMVLDSFQSSPAAPVAYDENTGLITWTAGTIGTEATMSYIIRARADFAGGNQVPTNDYATLTYTDINENPNKTKNFPLPKVDVPGPLTVNAGPDREMPLGSSIGIGDNLVVTGGSGAYTYLWTRAGIPGWSSSDLNPTVSPTEDTVYTVTVTDKYGCARSGNVVVTVLKGSITVVKKVLPNGSDTKVFPVYVEGNGNTWSMLLADGELATITGLAPGTYTIREVVPIYYRLVSISPSTVTIGPDNLTGKVTVTNRKVGNPWFWDDDEEFNNFSVGLW